MNQELLYRASALCAGSEHCCHDIQEKLKRWGASEEECNEIIDYLVDEKYIDEERFSKAYAKDKLRFNHWGRQKIDQGLRLLQICTAFRQQALSELPEQEYLDILKGILQSKQRGVKGRNNYERRGKLIRFALGRGFEMASILQCLPEDLKEDEGDYPDEDRSATYSDF